MNSIDTSLPTHSAEASEHLPYTTRGQELRQVEYNMRFKIQALELLRGLREPLSGLSALDFGCGRGEFLQMMREAGIGCVGVDIDPKCVELSSKFAPCSVATIDNLDAVLGGRRFDVVTCLHVLEHMESPRLAVERLAAQSKRWLIFAVPNLANPSALVTKQIKEVNPGHCQGWDPGHFKTFLERRCRLRIERWIPDVVCIPKFSRLFERLGIRRYFEYNLLPRKYPFLSTSLIVLCEKMDS